MADFAESSLNIRMVIGRFWESVPLAPPAAPSGLAAIAATSTIQRFPPEATKRKPAEAPREGPGAGGRAESKPGASNHLSERAVSQRVESIGWYLPTLLG